MDSVIDNLVFQSAFLIHCTYRNIYDSKRGHWQQLQKNTDDIIQCLF
jgi:hypothetical protein